MTDPKTTAPRFTSLTDQQLQIALSDIACSALSLASLLRGALERAGRTKLAEDINLAVMATERIGAIADHAGGGDVHGSFERWMLGPSFGDAEGQEAAHG